MSYIYNAHGTVPAGLTPGNLRQTAKKEGYLTKQGGIVRNWKRRLFILNGMALYYFVSTGSMEPQGVIQLRGASVTRNSYNQFPFSSDPKLVFAIDTPQRRFFVEADNESEYNSWIDAIQNAARGQVSQFYGQPIIEPARQASPPPPEPQSHYYHLNTYHVPTQPAIIGSYTSSTLQPSNYPYGPDHSQQQQHQPQHMQMQVTYHSGTVNFPTPQSQHNNYPSYYPPVHHT